MSELEGPDGYRCSAITRVETAPEAYNLTLMPDAVLRFELGRNRGLGLGCGEYPRGHCVLRPSRTTGNLASNATEVIPWAMDSEASTSRLLGHLVRANGIHGLGLFGLLLEASESSVFSLSGKRPKPKTLGNGD